MRDSEWPLHLKKVHEGNKMSVGGKDLSLQLSRQLRETPGQPSDESASEETKTSAGAGNSQSATRAMKGSDASQDVGQTSSRYLFVSFVGGDGGEFRIDLSKAIDAGAVARVACEPAQNALDCTNSAPSAYEGPEPELGTACIANATVDSITPTGPKRKQPKLIESGPAEHIGLGWTYKTYQRMNGATVGQTDTYWFSPVLQKKFRSRKEIDRFLLSYNEARSTLISSGVNETDVESINGALLESTAWDQFKADSSSSTASDKNVEKEKRKCDFTIDADGHAVIPKYRATEQLPPSHNDVTIDADGNAVKLKHLPRYGDFTNDADGQSVEKQYHSMNVGQDQRNLFECEGNTPASTYKDFTIDANSHAGKRKYDPNESGGDGVISRSTRCKYRLWEGRIREKFKGANYEGNVDHMVSIILANLRTVVDPNGPVTKHLRLSDCLLEEVISRCTGCSFDSLGRLQNKPRHGPPGAHVLQPLGRPLGMFQHRPAQNLRPLRAPPCHHVHAHVPIQQATQPPVLPAEPSVNLLSPRTLQDPGAAKGISKTKQTAKPPPTNVPDERKAPAEPLQKKKKQQFTWEERMEQLKRFKVLHGHCSPTKKNSDNDFPGLASWCANQRAYMKKKMAGDEVGRRCVPDENERRLRDIGFDFDPQGSTCRMPWEERFEQLRQFKEIHGHCWPAEKECIDKFEGLYQWCTHQRSLMRKKMAGNHDRGKLMTEEREKELRELGFDFIGQGPMQERMSWEERFEQLKLFKEIHGHCKPAERECIDDFGGLYQWYMHQKVLLKKKMAGDEDGKKKLPDAKEKKLRDIGCVVEQGN